VSTASRAAGSFAGRFWHLFPSAGAGHAALPTVEPGAELAQLSFHAGRVRADLLTRAPQVLPRLVSVGEFRHRTEGVLFPSDLAVGYSDGRLYLAEAATGRRLELLAQGHSRGHETDRQAGPGDRFERGARSGDRRGARA
jgi:hypothetical protein